MFSVRISNRSLVVVLACTSALCGAFWSGTALAQPEPAPEHTASVDSPAARGLSVQEIRTTMQGHRFDVRECVFNSYEGPPTQITLDIEMLIGSDGQVQEASMYESLASSSLIDACVVDVVERVEFPAPGQSLRVRYQFLFLVGTARDAT